MSIPMLKRLHRRALGISKDNQLIAAGGLVTGGDGKPSIVFPGPDEVAMFDDFLAPSVALGDTGFHTVHKSSQFFQAVTADTGRNIEFVRKSTNGVLRLNSNGVGVVGLVASSVHAVIGHTGAWKADMGPGGTSGRLRMAARIKCPGANNESGGKHENSWNTNGVFIGFTDTGVLGAFDTMPYFDTGEATEATDTGSLHVGTISPDFCGFYYGERSDTGWRGVSSSSGSSSLTNDSGDQEVLLTTVNPTQNKWITLEVELHRGIGDTGGTATFYIDGLAKGSINSPISREASLVPFVGQFISDTGGAQIDIDWIAVSGPRDTGT